MTELARLTDQIAALPPEQFGEVVDFVEFLTQKQLKRQAWERILAIAPALEAAGALDDFTEEDLQAEIDAARAERRARAAG